MSCVMGAKRYKVFSCKASLPMSLKALHNKIFTQIKTWSIKFV